MGKKKEFEDDLKKIKEIYFSAQETFLINKELQSEKGLSEMEVYLKRTNTFFYYCKIYFWRNTVLELSKLLNESENEKFNIPKFISKLKPSGHFRMLKFDEGFLNELTNRIDENQHLIDNLIEQRDKVYAHEDRNSENVKNIITHDQTEKLLEIVKDLIKTIYNNHYEIPIQFNLLNSPATNLKYIVNNLAKMQEIEEKEKMERIRKMSK